MEGEFGADLFREDSGKSPELWKSRDLSGHLTAATPPIGNPPEIDEVDFALALQASSSSKKSRTCHHAPVPNPASEFEISAGNVKGKEVSSPDMGGDDWSSKFLSFDDELSSIEHSKELNFNSTSSMDEDGENAKKWGKDWWWRQDGTGELCSRDYVMEWIGSQISPSNPDWEGEEEKKSTKEFADFENSTMAAEQENPSNLQKQAFGLETAESTGKKHGKKKQRKMSDWWKEEQLCETNKKGSQVRMIKRLKRRLKAPHFHFGGRKKIEERTPAECDLNGEFSFRRGWRKKTSQSIGSEMCSGDLFSRELSSTTSMRGTLCYVAPEFGGSGLLMEKADIYSFGVLVLVIVSGRRPLHVLASPMKLERANLISWCRHLAQTGTLLELVDERLKEDYSKSQASLCIHLALLCLQKTPESRPDAGEIVKILKGEMDLPQPQVPFEFSPSPPSRGYSKSRKKHKSASEYVVSPVQ